MNYVGGNANTAQRKFYDFFIIVYQLLQNKRKQVNDAKNGEYTNDIW